MKPTTLLRTHRAAGRVPFGRTLVSGIFRFAAPYFLTIPATIDELAPGHAVAHMHHRPWVRNHLGTVHAIALCNLAELTMGLAAEVTVPDTHRWIPRSMAVDYLAKARGTVTATASLQLPPDPDEVDVPAEVVVTDAGGTTVFTATIQLWVTRRPPVTAPTRG